MSVSIYKQVNLPPSLISIVTELQELSEERLKQKKRQATIEKRFIYQLADLMDADEVTRDEARSLELEFLDFKRPTPRKYDEFDGLEVLGSLVIPCDCRDK